MLKRLYIKNFAIVDEVELTFNKGLLVITGETGAGKSILVGALGLLCGDRSQTDHIRTGSKKAILEAEFIIDHNRQIKNILSNQSIENFNDILIIRREINLNGANRAFINDTPVTIAQLTEISELLLDLHGQHQHQRLLHPENHLLYLDAFGKINPILEKYNQSYHMYLELKNELDTLYNQKKS